jgi:hypothetical protein
MAATAAYVSISKVPSDAVPGDCVTFSNISATTNSFLLKGGTYGVTCKASTYGTVAVQVLAGDQASWLAAITAFAADGFASANLPPGLYRVALT